MLKPFPIDKEVRAIHILSWCVIVETLQALFILVFAFSFVPIRESEIVVGVLPQIKSLFRPEREMTFYRLWVLGVLGLQAASVYGYQRGKIFPETWKPRLQASLVWLGLQGIFAFKFLVHGQPDWARTGFVITLILAVAHKVYWTEIAIVLEKIRRSRADWKSGPRARFVKLLPCSLIVIAGFGVVWPSLDVMLAEVLRTNAFGPWDEKLLAPVWSMQAGLTAEAVRPSGLVFPGVMSRTARWWGGLTYENIAYASMVLLTFYYAMVVTLFYRIFRNVWLAAAGLVLMLQWELFHQGAAPVFWADVTRTPLTHLWDAGVLLCVWTLTRTDRMGPRIIGAVLTGVALAWSVSGIALWAAWIAFMMIRWKESPRSHVGFVAALPIVAAFVVIFSMAGPAFWTVELWQGLLGGIRDQLASPVGRTWSAWLAQTKQFFYFGWGLVWLSAYALGLWWIWWRRQQGGAQPQDGWWAALCVYGAGQWIFYGANPNTAGYTSASVVMVIIALTVTVRLTGRYANWLILPVFFFTLTNPLVVSYPFFGKRPSPDAESLRMSMGVEDGADLVQGYTESPDVFLISSFETPMLIESGRQNAWNHKPLMISTPFDTPAFAGSYVRTRRELTDMLSRMEASPERPVFIETRLIKGQIHPAYYQHYEFLKVLIPYLTKHYDIQDEGLHITVLRRKAL